MVMLYDQDLRETEPANKGDLVHDVLEFDAVVQVIHSGQSQVTQYPVEEGIEGTDHSIPAPREIQLIDAVVSDFPLLLPGESAVEQAVSTGSFSAESFEQIGNDAIDIEPLASRAYQLLERWRIEGRLLVLFDEFEIYDNVLIMSVSAPRSAGSTSALIARISLREMNIAESKLVTAPKTERASPKKSQGPKATTPATTAEEAAGDDTLLQGLLG
jgi:hypothetical protein